MIEPWTVRMRELTIEAYQFALRSCSVFSRLAALKLHLHDLVKELHNIVIILQKYGNSDLICFMINIAQGCFV